MEQRGNTVTVGIIGDGQLALMLADALLAHGIPFLCLNQNRNSSMDRAYPEYTIEDAERFQRECDVFTLENEFLKLDELKKLLKDKSDKIFPELSSYSHFADKVSQRKLYAELDLKSPRWMILDDLQKTPLVLEKFPYPFIVKASSGGYDGKGVRVVKSLEDFKQVQKDFGLYEGKTLLIEEKINIRMELAQGFLQDSQGHSTLLPLVDTVQENGICHFVYYPPQVNDEIKSKIQTMIQKLMSYPLHGIFNFEFFLDHEGEVYINEGAPRPHNSQHLTIDASDYSQFDLMALYLTKSVNLPTEIKTLPSVMINILGKSSGPNFLLFLPQIKAEVEIHPKLYSKEKSLPGRKMGHVNIVDKLGHNDLKIIAHKIFQEYKL